MLKCDCTQFEGEHHMTERIAEIRCASCGAPAEFDIVRQIYVCTYCGQSVGISEAQKQKQGFRKIQRDRLNESIQNFRLFKGSCTGCGAEIIFEENEALASCAFCGNSLVRKEYLKIDEMPESIIPFALTIDEAKQRLTEWCNDNSSKPEAKLISKDVKELKGFYLPYELIIGPVHMDVSRMDGNRDYTCEGFINDEFVNRSKNLDNLLLDGMEPYDLSALRGFEFGYVAGQRVRIPDVDEKKLIQRIAQEASSIYRPFVSEVLETDAVKVNAWTDDVLRLPVLLPVYYISKNGLQAAVNGQTGKVSVCSLKEKSFIFLPWWLKALIATIIFGAALYGALYLFGMDTITNLMITGMTLLIWIIVTLCYFSDTVRNDFRVKKDRDIYTSGDATFVRRDTELVLNPDILQRKAEKPVFFMELDGEEKPVQLKFTTPSRVLRMVLYCVIALFLPVMLALLFNGFDFEKLELGGSAAWFCIAVPVVPVYLLKFGIVELHDNPWIYILDEKGAKKRYHKPEQIRLKDVMQAVLTALFKPPVCFAVWFGIAAFITMVYLTAFGFD